ncbi:hypothetical protein JST99_00085 [Candidatus Dependentiae bacterium]|nr:hypothetical protein [Candidatus Dependentiae bacterium]
MKMNLLGALMVCSMVCTSPVFSSDQKPHPLQDVLHTLAGQKAWAATIGFNAKIAALDELEDYYNSTEAASSSEKQAVGRTWIAQQRDAIAQHQEAINKATTDDELVSVLKKDSEVPFWPELEKYRS